MPGMSRVSSLLVGVAVGMMVVSGCAGPLQGRAAATYDLNAKVRLASLAWIAGEYPHDNGGWSAIRRDLQGWGVGVPQFQAVLADEPDNLAAWGRYVERGLATPDQVQSALDFSAKLAGTQPRWQRFPTSGVNDKQQAKWVGIGVAAAAIIVVVVAMAMSGGDFSKMLKGAPRTGSQNAAISRPGGSTPAATFSSPPGVKGQMGQWGGGKGIGPPPPGGAPHFAPPRGPPPPRAVVVVASNDPKKEQQQKQQQQQPPPPQKQPPPPPQKQQQQQQQQPQKQQSQQQQKQQPQKQQQQKQPEKEQKKQPDPNEDAKKKLEEEKACYANCIGTDRNCAYGTSTKCEPTAFTRENRHLTVDRAMMTFSSCAGEPHWETGCLRRVFGDITKEFVSEAAHWVDQVGRRQSKLPWNRGQAMCPTPPGFDLNAESVRQMRFWCGNTRKDCPGALAGGRNVLAAAQDVEECLWSAEFHVNRLEVQSKRHQQCKTQCGWGEDADADGGDAFAPPGGSATPVSAPSLPEQSAPSTPQGKKGGWAPID